MGLFKDFRDMQKAGKEASKMKWGDKGRPSISDAIKMGSEVAQGAVQQQQLAQQLMESGVQGEATVISARDTGKTVNMMPEIEMELDVSVGGSTTRVNHRQIIEHSSVGMLTPGARIPVLVDKHDPTTLTITSGRAVS